ncbi:MAG: C4-dicarboxylate ABC transporter permease [Rhodospirillaceae bacterium]|nr:C4-dicarboxylate ABC transporter permease [Rhodospirillaceae bacterium]
MELVFLVILMLTMAYALGAGFPVAFALPGSAIITITLAALCGWLFAGNVDAYFAQGGAWQWLSAGVTNFRGVYWEAERDTLIAIPLFIFMGIMLQRSKLAEDLLVTMAQLFGPVPGGLGISVIFVGALLAATTGIVGATVVAMGLISLPAMMRNKYANSLSTGTIAASGTLGQIIPPSIVLIILADQLASAVDQASTARKELFKESTGNLLMPSAFDVTSTSAGEMFLGAFVPGLVLVGLYMAYVLALAFFKPHMAPAVHREGALNRAFMVKVFVTLVPPLTLIFLVLGSIITGVATVNQAGAIGAAGALIMGGYRLRDGHKNAYYPAIIALVSLIALAVVSSYFQINIKSISSNFDVIGLVLGLIFTVTLIFAIGWSGWRALKIEDTLQGVMVETAKTTALVFIILIGAAMLTAAFRAFGGEELVREFLTGMPGGFWAQFTIVMLVIFIMGFFLDFIEIAVVVVPIVAPILLMDPSANITAVWLGVMIGLNIQTSFLTPPFGFALFYLRGVAPSSVATIQMYRGVIPFICLQLVALVIVGLTPQLVNYLPQRVNLTSETAPPPRNPALSSCVEEHLFKVYDAKGDELRAAIAKARTLDISMLPSELRGDLAGSFDKAEKTFELVAKIRETRKIIDEATPAYLPLHVQVRDTQRQARRLKDEIKYLQGTIRQLPRNEKGEARAKKLEAKIEELRAEIKVFEAQMPENWRADHMAFVKLQKAEMIATRLYERNVDSAYEPLLEVTKVISSADTLAALGKDLAALPAVVSGATDPEKAMDAVNEVEKVMREVPGTREIQKPLTDARRAMRGDKPNVEKSLKALAEAQAAFDKDIAWRKKAAAELSAGLGAYEQAIRMNIGLRQQPKMSKEQALDVAACMANPRDLTLHF